MTAKNSYILLGLMLIICACNCNPVDKKAVVNNSMALNKSALTDSIVSTKNNGKENDSSIIIKFNELTIKLSRLIEFDADGRQKIIVGDSCYISPDIGETIFGQTVNIVTSSLTDIKVEQCFETSISISNEGPHCDLIDWKHYYSNWQTLKQDQNKLYKCIPHPEDKDLKFPKIDRKEFLEKVQEHCGDNFVEIASNLKQITPEIIGVSRVFLKISGQYKGKTVTKTIVIEESLGC